MSPPGSQFVDGLKQAKPSMSRPAEIQPSSGAWRLRHVDLLPCILPHIADVEVSGESIEGKAPGISQSQTPHLRSLIADAERILDSIGTGEAGLRIEAQKFTEQLSRILRAVVRISLAAPIPHAGVEAPVRSECQHPAVVVGERRVGNRQQGDAGAGIGDIAIERAPLVPGDDHIADRVGVENIETPVAVIAGVECESKQTSFSAARHKVRNVEERNRAHIARRNLDEPDKACLFHHKHAAHVARWRSQIERRREVLRDRLQPQGIGRRDRRQGVLGRLFVPIAARRKDRQECTEDEGSHHGMHRRLPVLSPCERTAVKGTGEFPSLSIRPIDSRRASQ